MSLEVIDAAAGSGGGVAVVTVIGSQGSVPRHTGSRMLVKRTGDTVGTVGGGRGDELQHEAGGRGRIIAAGLVHPADPLAVPVGLGAEGVGLVGRQAEHDQYIPGGAIGDLSAIAFRLVLQQLSDSHQGAPGHRQRQLRIGDGEPAGAGRDLDIAQRPRG